LKAKNSFIMKILMISTYDITGGAARAAFRLHKVLLQNKIDSKMLVATKNSDENSIFILKKSKKNLIEKIFSRLHKKFILNRLLIKYKNTMKKNWGPFSLQSVSNKELVKTINKINPDIVHLHWICHNFLSIEDIGRINAPIVWSLHDMWAFTGGCHYVAEQVSPHNDKEMTPCGGYKEICDKYTKKCGNCDFLGSNKTKDLSFNILERKKKTFKKKGNMTIIGLSEWIADCAKKSSVFSNQKILCLPNPIDTNIFKPMNKHQARALWNLPENKKLVLFGAISATSIPYKGYDLLIEALNKIDTKNIEFVVFGSSEPENPPKLPCKTHYLGHLHDDITLVSLYSASDVMIVPSKRENLSNVIMESLSCGTPVICFNIGGNSDMVNHKVNGYLAQPFDTSDLAQGINWVLSNTHYNELSKVARETIVRRFDYNVVAKRYIDLYEEVVNQCAIGKDK